MLPVPEAQCYPDPLGVLLVQLQAALHTRLSPFPFLLCLLFCFTHHCRREAGSNHLAPGCWNPSAVIASYLASQVKEKAFYGKEIYNYERMLEQYSLIYVFSSHAKTGWQHLCVAFAGAPLSLLVPQEIEIYASHGTKDEKEREEREREKSKVLAIQTAAARRRQRELRSEKSGKRMSNSSASTACFLPSTPRRLKTATPVNANEEAEEKRSRKRSGFVLPPILTSSVFFIALPSTRSVR